MADDDKPSAPRRSKRVVARLRVRWFHLGKKIEAVITDINAHGFFVRTNHPPELGSLIRLEIPLAGNTMSFHVLVRFVGKVGNRMGFGGELQRLTADDETHWLDHYEQLLVRLNRIRL
jgi:hypothetical protein